MSKSFNFRKFQNIEIFVNSKIFKFSSRSKSDIEKDFSKHVFVAIDIQVKVHRLGRSDSGWFYANCWVRGKDRGWFDQMGKTARHQSRFGCTVYAPKTADVNGRGSTANDRMERRFGSYGSFCSGKTKVCEITGRRARPLLQRKLLRFSMSILDGNYRNLS